MYTIGGIGLATSMDDQHGTEVIGRQVEGDKLTATGGRPRIMRRSVLGMATPKGVRKQIGKGRSRVSSGSGLG